LELPGGIVDKGESPAECAMREVVEETGWRPESVTHLLSYQPMPGLVDTPHHVFLGTNAIRVGEPADLEEAGVVDWTPLARVSELAEKGKLLGSGSLVGLMYLLASHSGR
jgi:8-oxo-dGTP pyrophosphatase MutT (NUDIX family)